jgi:hypothetical protein
MVTGISLMLRHVQNIDMGFGISLIYQLSNDISVYQADIDTEGKVYRGVTLTSLKCQLVCYGTRTVMHRLRCAAEPCFVIKLQ